MFRHLPRLAPLTVVLLVLCTPLALGIVFPWSRTPAPKVKEREDLKPLPDTSTTLRPPVRVYSGGRDTRPGTSRNRQGWDGSEPNHQPSTTSPDRERGSGGRRVLGGGEEGRRGGVGGRRGGEGGRRRGGEEGRRGGEETTAGGGAPNPGSSARNSPGAARNAQVAPGVLTCPGLHGLSPYPQDCAKFISCTWGRPYLQTCAPGTLFNPQLGACDWPHAVTCSTSPGIPTTANTPLPTRPTRPTRPARPARPAQPTRPARPTLLPTPEPAREGSSWNSFLDTVRDTASSAAGVVSSSASDAVDRVTNLIEDGVNTVRDEVDWTYRRGKDKGKRLLRRMGVKDVTVMCVRPNGLFPYVKDCGKFINCWKGRPSLQRCAPGTLFNSDREYCDHPAAVICPTSKAPESVDEVNYVVPPPSGQKLRLRGSMVPWAGYVEVSSGAGQWQLVTDDLDSWTREEAAVVCRTLGFNRGAESATQGPMFGLVPGRVSGVQRVDCQGEEENLQQCHLEPGTQQDVERTVVGVRCVKNWVSSCQAGWTRWGSKCYRLSTSSLVTHMEAREQCTNMAARLLSLRSQEENDFISELVGLALGETQGLHTGGARIQFFGETLWLWQNNNSTHTTPPTSHLEYSNWWTGWNITSRHGSGGAGVNGPNTVEVAEGGAVGGGTSNKCIVLKDTFPVDPSSDEQEGIRSTAPAEYFFWQLVDCSAKLHYVCERDVLDVGCIEGRGETYTGSANVTQEGAPCLAWDAPQLQQKVVTGGLQGLTLNHCANPDADDAPWCFTEQAKASYCDIPRCERTAEEEEEETVTVVSTVIPCGSDKFQCTTGGACIHKEWHCDGQMDCEDGSDEQGCRSYSGEFNKMPGVKLTGREVEKWLYTLKTTCAARCVQAKTFTCMSFNHQQNSETCILCDSTVGRSGGKESVAGWDHYEHNTRALNCSNKFVCADGKCLDNIQLCDGHRDCRGGEDEDQCQDQINFQVRLVNGTDDHQGRVEVRVFGRWGGVCDDMWGIPEGDVVCQELGFSLGAAEVFVGSHYGSGEGGYLMDDLNCAGSEGSLAQCDFAGWGQHDCQEAEAAGVRCFRAGESCGRQQWRCDNGRCIGVAFLCDTVDDCQDNSDEDRDMCQSPVEVRLIAGDGEEVRHSGGSEAASNGAGRVEINYMGVWGSVCDDDFGLEEGHVLCRMLGWSQASYVYKNNTFGPGTGPIWLDDVRCLGYEAAITDCQFPPWGQTNCDHNEDVGLMCSDGASGNMASSVAPRPSKGATTARPWSPPISCGRRAVEDTPAPHTLHELPKIVSGHTPPLGAHPWMVAINLRTKSGPEQWCGGAVLSEDYVLTAAHCVYKYPPSTYLLKFGDFNTHVEEEEEQIFRASSLAIHPLYDKGSYLNNDVAIIKILRKNGRGIQFGRTVQPLCLVAPRWNYPAYLNCTVAGWGSLGPTLGHSKVLQSALLPILPASTCSATYVYGPTRLTQGMYCAGYLEGGIDTCQGDSGGPMVCFVDGRHTVVGITSWGHGCARPNKPGVYTRLTKYLPWLYSNLG